jgi:hypothetical protein
MSDSDSVQNWCLDNDMKLNTGKTRVIFLAYKPYIINFNYKLCNDLVACSHYVKDLGILLSCKIYIVQRLVPWLDLWQILLACTVIFLTERHFLKLILLNLLLTLVMIFKVLVHTPDIIILFISLCIFLLFLSFFTSSVLYLFQFLRVIEF